MASFTGTDADDTYTGTSTGDTILGWGGNDTLNGAGGQDLIDGGEGNDALDGGPGADVLRGGAGDDFYIVDDVGDQIIEQADAGNEVVWSYVSIILSDNVETVVLKGDAAIDATGNDSNNWFVGNDASNVLIGGEGLDTFLGGGGNDTLQGGNGQDLYYVDDYTDLIIEEAGHSGFDQAIASVSYTLAANLESLYLAGTANIDGYGNESDNSIIGNSGINILSGGAGDDTILSGLGSDTLTGGAGNDTFEDSAAALNGDTITDLAAGDRIIIRDVSIEDFTFSLTGSTLTYSGGSLTLEGDLGSHLVAARHPFYNDGATGVVLTLVQDVDNDFNGDGRSDIMFRQDNGTIYNVLGSSSGGFVSNDHNASTTVDLSWGVAATGDFNGDGRDDVLWRNDHGAIFNFLSTANGGFENNGDNSWMGLDASWTVSGVGDFNGDGKDDVLFRDANGVIFNYLGTASGGFTANSGNLFTDVGDQWHVAGVGDFNGDGRDDILWRHDNGAIFNFLGTPNGGVVNNGDNIYTIVDNAWHVAGIGDFNGDGRDDILWRNDNGAVFNFLGTANGGVQNNGDNSYTAMSNDWQIEAIGDYDGNNRDDILWSDGDGAVMNWLGSAAGGFTDNSLFKYLYFPLDWQIVPPDALI